MNSVETTNEIAFKRLAENNMLIHLGQCKKVNIFLLQTQDCRSLLDDMQLEVLDEFGKEFFFPTLAEAATCRKTNDEHSDDENND